MTEPRKKGRLVSIIFALGGDVKLTKAKINGTDVNGYRAKGGSIWVFLWDLQGLAEIESIWRSLKEEDKTIIPSQFFPEFSDRFGRGSYRCVRLDKLSPFFQYEIHDKRLSRNKKKTGRVSRQYAFQVELREVERPVGWRHKKGKIGS